MKGLARFSFGFSVFPKKLKYIFTILIFETLAEKLSSPLPSQEGQRLCFSGSEVIGFVAVYDVSIELWKYSDNVPFFVYHFILNYYMF